MIANRNAIFHANDPSICWLEKPTISVFPVNIAVTSHSSSRQLRVTLRLVDIHRTRVIKLDSRLLNQKIPFNSFVLIRQVFGWIRINAAPSVTPILSEVIVKLLRFQELIPFYGFSSEMRMIIGSFRDENISLNTLTI